MFYYIIYFRINIFKFIKINNKNGLIVVKNYDGNYILDTKYKFFYDQNKYKN